MGKTRQIRTQRGVKLSDLPIIDHIGCFLVSNLGLRLHIIEITVLFPSRFLFLILFYSFFYMFQTTNEILLVTSTCKANEDLLPLLSSIFKATVGSL